MAGKVRHWKERNGRYSARVVVPPRLRPYLDGKAELEIQLGPDKREARAKHAGAVAAIQHQIALAKDRHAKASGSPRQPARYPLKPDQLAIRHYLDQIAFDTDARQSDHRFGDSMVDENTVAELRAGIAGRLDDDALDRLVGYRIEHFRFLGTTNAVKGSPEWRDLAMKLCVSEYEAMARHFERNEGDFTGRPSHPLLTSIEDGARPSPEITFDQIIDEEVKWRTTGKDAKGVKPDTIRKFRYAADLFAKHRKSDDATTVTREEGEAWIAHMAAEGKFKAKTIQVHVVNVSTVLSWGAKRFKGKFPPHSALLGIDKPEGAYVPPEERTFTMDEARKILTVAKGETSPKFRFIPWITAYSGARVSEIAQLRPEDFFQIGDAWFYRITTRGGKGVKTNSSIRRVPIHADLQSLGLIEFVKSASAEKPLFGTSVQPRMSEWMRDVVKLQREYMAPNHSWRHLFEDLCTLGGVNDDARAYMTGRSTRSSRERYGRSEVALPGLAREMAKVPSILPADDPA